MTNGIVFGFHKFGAQSASIHRQNILITTETRAAAE